MSSIHPPQDEIVLLRQKIQQTDIALEQFQRFQRQRFELLKRLNAAQAATKNIPPEILTHILRFACPVIEFCQPGPITFEMVPPVLRLAAVCSLWRQIAISTPDLWTDISIRITGVSVYTDMDMMESFFKNASGRLLSLKLSFEFFDEKVFGAGGSLWRSFKSLSDGSTLPPPPSLQQFALQVLTKYIHKIETLHLHCIPNSWLHDTMWAHCNELVELQLHWPEINHFRFNEVFSPPESVRQLSLGRTPHHLRFRLHNNITVLKLHQVRISQAVDLLPQCHSLLVFSFLDPVDPIHDEAEIAAVITMTHLEELEWDWTYTSWSHAFLEYFRFPALKLLKWRVSFDTAEYPPICGEFFDRLPTSMPRLEIAVDCIGQWRPSAIPTLFMNMLHHFPNITTLLVEVATTPFDPRSAMVCTDAILDILQKETHDNVDNADFLPSLKALYMDLTLIFGTQFADDDYPSIDSTKLAKALVTRAGKGLQEFGMLWYANLIFKPEDEKIIDSLIEGGLNVEII